MDQNTVNDWSSAIFSVPLWEVMFLMVLVWITIYRKRLSSNDEYRQPPDQLSQKQLNMMLRLPESTQIINKYNYMLKNMKFSLHKPDYRSTSTNSNCALNKLSAELLVHLLGYLDTHEIVTVSITSSQLRVSLTSDIIWEQLWRVTYGTHWRHPVIKQLRADREIFWDPADNFGPPQTGWYHFYLAFEVCWLDWLLAGYASLDKCVLAIDNAIFDVTDFMFDHPGSPETLTECAGCDASEIFVEIGHSLMAEGMKNRLCVWDLHGQYTLQTSLRSRGMYTIEPHIRAKGIRVPRSSKLQRYMRQMQKAIAARAMETLPLLTPNRGNAQAAQQTIRSKSMPADVQAPFGPTRCTVKDLGGYYQCPGDHHPGQPLAFYDPLAGEWSIWWSCCGRSQTYKQGPNSLFAESRQSS